MPEPGAEPRIVSPLRRLLMEVGVDMLLDFLHRSQLQFALSRNRRGTYNTVIYKDGLARYRGGSLHSPRAALADALANFLCHEDKDYHEYGWEPKSQEEEP